MKTPAPTKGIEKAANAINRTDGQTTQRRPPQTGVSIFTPPYPRTHVDYPPPNCLPITNTGKITPMPALTPTELAALQLINRGYTYVQSASILGMCAATLRKHLRQACTKLDVANPADAVQAAINLGLLVVVEKDVHPPAPIAPKPALIRPTTPPAFTEIEAAALQLLPGYPSRRQIAERMGIPVKHVGDIIDRLYKKLGVHTQADAVRVARALGLVPDRHMWK